MAYDKIQKVLLEASIDHWRENLEAMTPYQANVWGDSCPLCRYYANNSTHSQIENCKGCPVSLRTKKTSCDGSPWENAMIAHDDWHEAYAATTGLNAAYKRWQKAAQKQLDFLISLREVEKAKP